MTIKKQTEYEKFLRWTNGNHAAANFLNDLARASQKIDDIYDGDNKCVIDVVSSLLFATAVNPFFATHRGALTGVLFSSLIMWGASNRFAGDDDEKTLMFGFVYREILEQIIPLVALLCGQDVRGAINVAEEVHHYYHREMTQDTFTGWVKEVKHG